MISTTGRSQLRPGVESINSAIQGPQKKVVFVSLFPYYLDVDVDPLMRAKLGRLQNARSPHAINPTNPTQGHFALSPVLLARRDQDDGPVELNDRHLQSHGKIGDCEQSKKSEPLQSHQPVNFESHFPNPNNIQTSCIIHQIAPNLFLFS